MKITKLQAATLLNTIRSAPATSIEFVETMIAAIESLKKDLPADGPIPQEVLDEACDVDLGPPVADLIRSSLTSGQLRVALAESLLPIMSVSEKRSRQSTFPSMSTAASAVAEPSCACLTSCC